MDSKVNEAEEKFNPALATELTNAGQKKAYSRAPDKLSALAITRLKDVGYYGDGLGLYLQVFPLKSQPGKSAPVGKSWVFKYRLNQKDREMGLGPLHTISLAKAREMAGEKRALLLEGKDPIQEREIVKQRQHLEAASRLTFEECALKFIDKKKSFKSPKSKDQWINSLTTYVFPHIGKLAAADIDGPLVLRCLDPIWATKHETASRLRGRIENILNWAKERGYRSGENPATWGGRLEHALADPKDVAQVEHFPALPYTQMREFITDLRRRHGIVASALEFAILTTSRSGPVRAADWSEVDIEGKFWTCPASHMKIPKEHRVPLSDRAIEILTALPNREGLVFPSPRAGNILSDSAMNKLITDINETRVKAGLPRWIDPTTGRTVVQHGFRSSFRVWASKTRQLRELAEEALAHAFRTVVEGAYDREDLSEERRPMMDAWGRWCDPLQPGNVVEISSKAA